MKTAEQNRQQTFEEVSKVAVEAADIGSESHATNFNKLKDDLQKKRNLKSLTSNSDQYKYTLSRLEEAVGRKSRYK